MIAAFDSVAFDAAFAQGQLAVRAGVFQPDKFACFCSINADIFAQDSNLLKFAGDFVIPRGNIPCILQKHIRVLSV
jgi:hypothetical protein